MLCFNKKFLFTVCLVFTFVGCGGGSSSKSSTSSTTSSVSVTKGPLLMATARDAKGKIGTQVNNSNVYEFEDDVTYPITVTGGYVDVNNNGIVDSGDYEFTGTLSSYSEVVTPITTFVGDTSTDEGKEKLETLKSLTNASDDDLLNTDPIETNTEVLALLNSVYETYSVLFDDDETNDDVSEIDETQLENSYTNYQNVITSTGSDDLSEILVAVEEELKNNTNPEELTAFEIAKLNFTKENIIGKKLEVDSEETYYFRENDILIGNLGEDFTNSVSYGEISDGSLNVVIDTTRYDLISVSETGFDIAYYENNTLIKTVSITSELTEYTDSEIQSVLADVENTYSLFGFTWNEDKSPSSSNTVFADGNSFEVASDSSSITLTAVKSDGKKSRTELNTNLSEEGINSTSATVTLKSADDKSVARFNVKLDVSLTNELKETYGLTGDEISMYADIKIRKTKLSASVVIEDESGNEYETDSFSSTILSDVENIDEEYSLKIEYLENVLTFSINDTNKFEIEFDSDLSINEIKKARFRAEVDDRDSDAQDVNAVVSISDFTASSVEGDSEISIDNSFGEDSLKNQTLYATWYGEVEDHDSDTCTNCEGSAIIEKITTDNTGSANVVGLLNSNTSENLYIGIKNNRLYNAETQGSFETTTYNKYVSGSISEGCIQTNYVNTQYPDNNNTDYLFTNLDTAIGFVSLLTQETKDKGCPSSSADYISIENSFGSDSFKNQTMYVVWYGMGYDSNGDEIDNVAVVEQYDITSDGSGTLTSLKNSVDFSGVIGIHDNKVYSKTTDSYKYDVDSYGEYVSGSLEAGCIKTNYIEDGQVDNVELIFTDKDTAMDFANTLTSTITNCPSN